jgi:hypothetical protein
MTNKTKNKSSQIFKEQDIQNQPISFVSKLGFEDPAHLTFGQRSEYLGQALGIAKTLSPQGLHHLIDQVLIKQNTVSVSATKPQILAKDKKSKLQDQYLLNKIQPMLDKFDNLGLDYLRIHLRDMAYNLGQELKDKMLFKRFEIRMLEKFQALQNFALNLYPSISIEIKDFLDKNEIHLQIWNKDDQDQPNQALKNIILNTKTKMVTFLHLDKNSENQMQTLSLHDNNFTERIYTFFKEIEAGSSLIQNIS